MSGTRVKCLRCSAVLAVPADVTNERVRCPVCRGVFRVRVHKKVSLDETVADWLDDSLHRDEPVPAGSDPGRTSVPVEIEGVGEEPRAIFDEGGQMRLVALDRRGVLLEFPADFLRAPAFRVSIPRRCIHCAARAHLSAHLVIYTPRLRDSISLEAEHAAGNLSISQDKLGNFQGVELLEHLPEVPNVPPPGNLPMPYWVCDMCRGAGCISGRIRVNTDTGKGLCRLYFRNLRMAMGFFANACGTDSDPYRQLAGYYERTEEDPWDAMPTVVRNRLEQWYRPGEDERFLAYIPDRSFVRTEDGMNGLVVSDHRLVYHRPPRHQELAVGQELAVHIRAAMGEQVAILEGADFKRRLVKLDRGGRMLLRRALSEGGFNANWR
ncbi:MAG TPA: hypothetical protein VFJ30_13370 [Phycisphaerae bacterium]|nr:hypothetical protein [Phycisphaerae bacterium]